MPLNSLIPHTTALKGLLEASSESILFVMPDYRLGLLNDSFRTILFSFWGVVANIGEDINPLLDIDGVRQFIGPAIKGALNGHNGSYSFTIEKHGTSFYFEVASFAMPAGIGGLIMLKDLTETKRKAEEVARLELALQQGYHLMDMLTQQVKLQNRHILRAPSLWAQILQNTDPSIELDYDQIASKSLFILGLSINNALNKFIAASDVLNKKLVLTEGKHLFNQDLKQQFDPLKLMCDERLNPLTITIADQISDNKTLELAYDQTILQTILLSFIEVAFLRSNGNGIDINVRVQDKCVEDCTILFEIDDHCETPPNYEQYISGGDYLAKIKSLPKYYQIPYVGLRYTHELIKVWGGSISINQVGITGYRWTISLNFKHAEPKVYNIQAHLLVLAHDDGLLSYLTHTLEAEGHTTTLTNNVEDVKAMLLANTLHPFDGLLIQTDINMFRQEGKPDNTAYYYQALTDKITGWQQACEAAGIKPPTLIAVQMLPTIFWQGRLQEMGVQLSLPIPLEPNSLKLLQASLSASISVSDVGIVPSHVDTSYLTNLAGNDPVFWRDMIMLFIQNVPIAVAELEILISQHNYHEAAACIHKLKSNLKLMGLADATISANTLEQQYLSRTISPDHNEIYSHFKQLLQGGVKYYNRKLSELNLEANS